ncbi:MAG: YggS family pyridoxal phosphate-dependent enzyme [Actinomycetota bacterium]|nr:YggS family pyridoxal phosphate-dependent enzyme [Actinomycetota bacterium]
MNDRDPNDRDALVAERLAAVHERIARAGGTGVTVLPVTKTFGIEACWAAYRAGCTAVGENYAQEIVAKFGGLELPFHVHFIGQLQSNKVRQLAPLVAVFESVDRASVVAELAKRTPGVPVLVQVSAGHEQGKGGCEIGDAPALVRLAQEAGLEVRGLMTVGPTTGGPEEARAGFRAVRALTDRLGLAVCSMGMTADLEVAVQEGSTEVRVGSALFGERPPFRTLVR